MYYTFMQHCVANRKYKLAKEKETSSSKNKDAPAKREHLYGGLKYNFPEDISKLDIETHPTIRSLRSEHYHPFDEKDKIDLTEKPGIESTEDLLSKHFSNLVAKKAHENLHDVFSLTPEDYRKLGSDPDFLPEKPYYASDTRHTDPIPLDYLQDEVPSHELHKHLNFPERYLNGREPNLEGMMAATLHHWMDNYNDYLNDVEQESHLLNEQMRNHPDGFNPRNLRDREHFLNMFAQGRLAGTSLDHEIVHNDPKTFIEWLNKSPMYFDAHSQTVKPLVKDTHPSYRAKWKTNQNNFSLEDAGSALLHQYLRKYITHAFRGQ